ncbi:Os12g0517700 [Oryza sativa Japonica Group]|uniref:Os12g0517700 protein n=1 Tax=Oryza sativa subsp. japonica TaxID=39947 RepID=A0A0P0YAR6_ORYSJ|nr:Os12g0517700 [Oryza sativa Japonica Group]
MAISAARLEVFSCESLVDPERLEFDGAAAVRRIKKLRLMSFGGGGGDDQYDANAAAVWLLKNCNAVVHLGVKLDIYVDEVSVSFGHRLIAGEKIIASSSLL